MNIVDITQSIYDTPNWVLWAVVFGLVDVLLFIHIYMIDEETPIHQQQKTSTQPKPPEIPEILEQHVLTLHSGNIWGVLNLRYSIEPKKGVFNGKL